MTPQSSNRSRTRRVLSLAALAFAIGLMVCTTALAESVVEQSKGSVEVGRGEPPTWQPLAAGDALQPNDRIRTGADGRVEIRMDAGTMRVHENSMLVLPAPSGVADRVDLERGNSLFDVLRRKGRRFEVHTPTVVVSVKGTRFGVDAKDEVGAVSVYRGLVGVREAGVDQALETLVREGFTASGGTGIAIELDLSPEGDPWARWQDFQSQMMESQPAAPAPGDELDRARETLHRATGAAVIERAAERRPEVAERLEKMKRERGRDSGPSGARDRSLRPMPAAPAPGLMGENDDRQRNRLQRERQEKREQVLDLMRNTDQMGPGGNGPITGSDLAGIPGPMRSSVIHVLQDLDLAFTGGAPPTQTATEMYNMITAELMNRGFDANTADSIATELLD